MFYVDYLETLHNDYFLSNLMLIFQIVYVYQEKIVFYTVYLKYLLNSNTKV